jgi:glycosyltransferase involved in cell wall biosynthesis
MPKLSIIVIFHNMQREAKRTLHSLSTAYQNDVSEADYEVIAIDNASRQPLNAEQVKSNGANFRYHFYETCSVSPVDAVNTGVEMATGEHIAVIVDGARMSTPGLVGNTIRGLTMQADAFVCSLSWHLGPDIQGMSMQDGYNQAVEDQLLDSILWPQDGYRLFDISTIAPSSRDGFFGGVPPECSWFAMPRASFLKMGGFDPQFQSPGGGFVNHDFRNRVLADLVGAPIVLLGEGVFHQFHGGVATNIKTQDLPKTLKVFKSEYQAMRPPGSLSYTPPPAMFLGTLPQQARRFLNKAKK